VRNLLLTLGHNSSAILVEDGRIVWGYETERLTGLKSDSHFPRAVLDARGLHKLKGVDMAYVTHWAPDGRLPSMSAKHWDPTLFDGIPIRSLTADCTHHDTHIAAARLYAGHDFISRPKTFGLVIDGFGTYGEHLSVYEFVKGSPILRKRIHGYETSLGLWYQYATAFMGMKMHEDEYKLLGYEVHCPMNLVDQVNEMARAHANHWLERMDKSVYGSKYDPLYDIAALAKIKELHFKTLTNFCEAMEIDDPSAYLGRSIIAKFVQRVLENVVMDVLGKYGPIEHLLCSGGVFLNVKLNAMLIDRIQGQLCVYPLAGDQGNALGLYHMDHPYHHDLYENLNWGRRALRNVGKVAGISWLPEDQAKAYALDLLKTRGYVNIVRGDMEFGPRALCNTTTLAIPTAANVSKINSANNRNTVMPMAPVMTPFMYNLLFENTHKVWKSEEHMIVAMRYRDAPTELLRGIAHRYPEPLGTATYTGRPQVIDERDSFMFDILTELGHPLINTSFNFHGQPIAFDSEQVIKNHVMQYERDDSFETIIISN
jgi:carbamoyltransferase